MLNFILGNKITIFFRLFFHGKLHHISTEFLILGEVFFVSFLLFGQFFQKLSPANKHIFWMIANDATYPKKKNLKNKNMLHPTNFKISA